MSRVTLLAVVVLGTLFPALPASACCHNTETTLTPSVDPSAPGETVTFAIRVCEVDAYFPFNPAGGVDIDIDGMRVATVPLDDYEPLPGPQQPGCTRASYATADLTVGNHAVLASYRDHRDAETNPSDAIYVQHVGGLRLSPSAVSFGDHLVGAPSAPVTVTVRALTPSTISSVSASEGFGVTGDGCTGLSLVTDETCEIAVAFGPATDRTYTGKLVVGWDAGASATHTTLDGRGVAAHAALDPASIDFGNVQVLSASEPHVVTVTNTGTYGLTITSFTVMGEQSSGFSITDDACTGASIAPGGSCSATVTFRPGTPGHYEAPIVLTSNALEGAHSIPLRGEATLSGGPPVCVPLVPVCV